MSALLMLPLLAFAGFAVDIGYWYTHANRMQRAADAAALAGVVWMPNDEKAETVRKGFLARVPKGRLGEPSDLAGPLLFLTSRASDFYTGHILYADGGYTAG